LEPDDGDRFNVGKRLAPGASHLQMEAVPRDAFRMTAAPTTISPVLTLRASAADCAPQWRPAWGRSITRMLERPLMAQLSHSAWVRNLAHPSRSRCLAIGRRPPDCDIPTSTNRQS
jgi:hypothetical protein